jgi:hypothetical protein
MVRGFVSFLDKGLCERNADFPHKPLSGLDYCWRRMPPDFSPDPGQRLLAVESAILARYGHPTM